VAAQVGDVTISVAEIDQLAAGIVAAYNAAQNPVDPSIATRVAVQGLVVGTLLNQADDKGESILPAASVTSLTQPDPTLTDPTQIAQAQTLATLVKTIMAVPGGTDWLRGELTLGQTQPSAAVSTALTSLIQSVPVTVNPRFGNWDASAGGFVPEGGSLSVPAPTPAP